MYTNPKCWGFHPSMPSGQGFLPWGSTFNLRVRLQSAGLLPLLTALPTIHHHHCLMPDTNHKCCKRFFCSHPPLPTSDTESQISWWILVTFMKSQISRWILVISWRLKYPDEYWSYSLVSPISRGVVLNMNIIKKKVQRWILVIFFGESAELMHRGLHRGWDGWAPPTWRSMEKLLPGLGHQPLFLLHPHPHLQPHLMNASEHPMEKAIWCLPLRSVIIVLPKPPAQLLHTIWWHFQAHFIK